MYMFSRPRTTINKNKTSIYMRSAVNTHIYK